MNESILYGHDHEENIVAVDRMKDRSMVKVYTRDGSSVNSRVEHSPLFAYVNSSEPALRSINDNSTNVHPMLGSLYYDQLITTRNNNLLYALKRKCEHINIPSQSHQYYIKTGKTLFKGMEFDDHRALAFDIETYTTDGYDFSNASRKGDKITIIAMYDTTGWFRIIHGLDMDEPQMLKEFIKEIHLRDPDVLVGHNVFNFDLPYIEERCMRYDIDLSIGRNGEPPYTYDTSMKLADRDRAYTNYCIDGRHVIDTELLARKDDIRKRSYENYRLKYLAKEIGVASESRTYVEGDQIADVWDNDPHRLISYALDDVMETIGLYRHFGQASFYSTQFFPMGYQDVFRLGDGSKIDNMFMRYYIEHMYSFSKPESSRDISGGYADVFEYGYMPDPLVYADVSSLYPSLAEVLEIQPSRESLGMYQKLLKLLKSKRYEVKAKGRAGGPKAEMWNSMDGIYKRVLNTMSYGYLSWDMASFNDYDEAERITTGGRKILKQMISRTEEMGGIPVKADTDGFLTTVPAKFDGADDYIEELSESFEDDRIIIDNDGEYNKAMIFDKKSYAMENEDGSVTLKGQTVRGRSIEPFGLDFIEEGVHFIFKDQQYLIPTLFEGMREMIEDRKIDLSWVVSRGNIKESFDEYLTGVELGSRNGGRNRDAPYELALKDNKDYQVGDVINYYVKQPPMVVTHFRNKKKLQKPKLRKYESAEFADLYDNDHDKEYYVERLGKHFKKFMSVFPQEVFEKHGVKITAKDKRKYKNRYT